MVPPQTVPWARVGRYGGNREYGVQPLLMAAIYYTYTAMYCRCREEATARDVSLTKPKQVPKCIPVYTEDFALDFDI